MDVVIIAAVARNGVIGKENRLPWHLPEDLAHFKALTLDQAVIMGRKTWESLPSRFRPLPRRQNIVVTRARDYAASGACLAHTLEEALAKVEAGKTAYVIGGAQLYAQALPYAQRLELTEIDADFEGDAHFPAFTRSAWRELRRTPQVSVSGLRFAFVSYVRTQST
ncbi:MAG: dihydrofolate reductase [Rhodocyclaceae bacterium]|nr:dihydrofolate reductase [Rhodocyclaceae bacterium]